MKTTRSWLLAGIACLTLIVVAACGPGKSPTPTPSPAPTTKLSASVTPSASPSAKPPSSPSAATVSFAGKTVTIVVGMAAGGSTDLTSRVYARYLSKYLPGRPSVLVRNMPGGQATIAGNYVYASRPDGLTTGSTSSSTLMSDFYKLSACKYDLLKMPVILGTTTGDVVVIKSGIVSKPEDLPRAKGIIFGGTSGGPSLAFVIAKEILGIPTEKVILAYTGGADSIRAFIAGEINVNAMTPPTYHQTIAPLEKKGETMPLFQVGEGVDDKGKLVKSPVLPPNIFTVDDLYEKINGKPPSGIAWTAYKGVVAVVATYKTLLILAPGTPENITRAYWEAADKMVKDPDFMKEADAITGGATWRHGEAYDKAFKRDFALDASVITWIKSLLAKYNVAVE